MEADAGERDRWLAGAAALAADVLTAAPAQRPGRQRRSAAGDSGYAWQHGLYWLASNLSADSPLVLVVDDLQWCDAPSARALAFIARRLEGQPLGLILATRPLDPALTPEAATLVGDPAAELLRPAPLTEAAVGALVADRLAGEPDERLRPRVPRGDRRQSVPRRRAARARRRLAAWLPPRPRLRRSPRSSRAASRTRCCFVWRGCRRQPAALARALSVLGDGAQVGDAARLAGLAGAELEAAMAALVSAGIVESGGTVRFTHPILRSAIYGDLSPAERERLHQAAAQDPARARSARRARSRRTSCTPSRPPTRRRWRCCGTPPATRWPGRRSRRGRVALPRPRGASG